MLFTAWPIWVIETVTTVCSLCGFVILAWALWGDRPKGRRRCPKCWYDMKGTPGLTCPECGHDAQHERRLFKTRRQPRVIALALFLLVAARAAYIVPGVVARGWIAAVPTGLLIFRFDSLILPGPLQDVSAMNTTELSRRANSGAIVWWDRWWIGKRILNDMDLDNSIKMRDAIVANLPLGITLDKELPRAFVPGLRIRVTPVWGFLNTDPLDLGGFAGSMGIPLRAGGAAILPAPNAGAASMVFDIALVDLLGNTWATQRVTRPVHYVKSVNDVMTPAKDPVFHSVVLRFTPAPSGVAVRIAMGARIGGLPSMVSVGLDIQFRYRDEVRATLALAIGMDDRPYFWGRCCPDPILVPLGSTAPDDPGWSVVIKGSPDLAYVDPEAAEYWGGTKTVRLADVLGREWVPVTFEPTKAP